MIVTLRLLHPILLSWVLFLRVGAQRNVTLDDQDTSIVYAPPTAWSQTDRSSLDHGGAHMLTSEPGATATFKFTGTAIYFLSPKWPYTVNVGITLDSEPLQFVDLVDYSQPDTGGGPETMSSSVVWNATGLANVQHTLVVSVVQEQPYAIVDGLIYTVVDVVDPTSSSSSSSSSSSLSSSTSSSSSSSSLSSSTLFPSTTSSSTSSSSSSTHFPSTTSSLSSSSSSSTSSSSSSTSSFSSASLSANPFSPTISLPVGTAPSASSSYNASSSFTAPAASKSALPSTGDSSANRKRSLIIALGSISGVLALLLIFGIVCFRRLSRRRRRVSTWLIDGTPSDGNSLRESGNRHRRGHSQTHLIPRDTNFAGHPYGHSIEQMADITRRTNSQNGLVGNRSPPSISPPLPAHQLYYALPQNQYPHGATTNPYVILSPIAESSSPPMVGPHSPLLASTSAIGLDMLAPSNTDGLPGYSTAPASEAGSRRQTLVVVGDDETQTGTSSVRPLSLTKKRASRV